MIQPPMIGATMREKLSIEAVAPSTPPRRCGGAIRVIKLISDGRTILLPSEKKKATKESFHHTSAQTT